jgi:predicted amidophosphoribosyltransferase
VRSRGRDHVRELADAAAAELRAAGVPASRVRLLGRVAGRRVRDSAGLDAAQRRENLAGRFRALPAGLPPASRVVLVDDIVSSGATLTEAARALRSSADTPVLAAVVAATPRRARQLLPVAGAGAFTVRG